MSAHDHCPLECEHPQAFLAGDGKRYCGRCLHVCGIETPMVPCTPDVCPDRGIGE